MTYEAAFCLRLRLLRECPSSTHVGDGPGGDGKDHLCTGVRKPGPSDPGGESHILPEVSVTISSLENGALLVADALNDSSRGGDVERAGRADRLSTRP